MGWMDGWIQANMASDGGNPMQYVMSVKWSVGPEVVSWCWWLVNKFEIIT